MSSKPQSTRCGNRPQAILHPHGNKGADLIETIRLEKASAFLKDERPITAPDLGLFIRPHHSDPAEKRATRGSWAARPGVGGPGERAWAQPRWTRPQSAGVMHVHSSEALQDFLKGSGEAEDDNPEGISSRLASPVPGGEKGSQADNASFRSRALSNAATSQQQSQKQRPQSAYTLADMRQRQRLQQKQQETHERVMRKLRETQAERAAAQEKQFQKSWEQFHTEQEGPVADIERMLRLKDIEYVRRATAHAKQWNEDVFERIQTQVDKGLRKREANGSYNTRWRTAQDNYLRTLKKKDAGIFRDIVIEAEYDPLENCHNTIKYSSKKVNLRDPLKLEIRKHEQESKMVPGARVNQLRQDLAPKSEKLCRECFDVKLWPHLESTPYGHFNKIDLAAETKVYKPSNTGERVLGNHYNYPGAKGRKPITPPPTLLE